MIDLPRSMRNAGLAQALSYQRPEELTVFLPARLGGTGLGFTWSPLKPLKRTKEERGFDEAIGCGWPLEPSFKSPFLPSRILAKLHNCRWWKEIPRSPGCVFFATCSKPAHNVQGMPARVPDSRLWMLATRKKCSCTFIWQRAFLQLLILHSKNLFVF
jgi:hypothetical protein